MTTYAIRTSLLPSTSRRPVTASLPGRRRSCSLRCRGLSGWLGVRVWSGSSQTSTADDRRRHAAVVEQRGVGGEALLAHQLLVVEPARRGPGAGCAASGGPRRLLGSAPCLVTLVRVQQLDDALAPGRRRRRRDLPAGRRPAPRGDGGATAPDGRGRRRPGRHLRAPRHRPAAGARASAGRCRSWSPAAPGSSPGPAGLCAQAGAATSPASRSRCATSTTWPATPGGWCAATPTTSSTARCPVYVELPHVGGHRAWLAAADEVAAAELRLKFRTGGLEAAAFPAAHALAALDRRGARPRDAVQVHGRAAQRGPAHRRRRLRAPRLPQRAGRDPAGLRRRRAGRGGGDAGAARRRRAGRRRWAARPRRRAALVHVVRLLLGRRAAGTTCASWGSSMS